MSRPGTVPSPARPVSPGPLKRLLWSYRALLTVDWAIMLQYRAAVFLWTIWSFINPVIFLSVWSAVAGEGAVAGYARTDFVTYYLVMMVLNHFIEAWQVYTFGEEIRNGTLSHKLLRPVDPVHHVIAENVVFKVVNLPLLLPIWGGLVWYFRPALPAEWERWAGFVAALALAGALRFLWTHCFAALSFWTTRSTSIHDLAWHAVFVLGGMLAPVALLPGLLRDIAVYLPFRYLVAFPIDVLMGRPGAGVLEDAAALWQGFLLQLAWILVALAVYRALWRIGLRRYTAVGI